jgi:hypothetical protein
MPFYKTASAPIVGVYESSGKFTKRAQQNDDISEQQDRAVRQAINILSGDVLKAVARIYNLSDDINDYIFPVPRAVTASIPNNNGDCFEHEELTRFSPVHRCQVYQTFRNDPLHVEHAASDPKTARGYLPDVFYMTGDPKDHHVLTVVGVDTTKDRALAEGVLDGTVNKFSMGCICASVVCTYCNKEAFNDREMCDHLLWYKMAKLNGKLVYEKCRGVEFQELSAVKNPADPKALTQALLKYASRQAAQNNVRATLSVLSSLVSKEDAYEVARFFQANAGKLPDSMMRLADKLF